MLTDLRFALRQLWKNPGFTLVAVLALALGIGANTAIFSVVNAVLLKPLPFPEPERLVAVGSVRLRDATAAGVDAVSYADFFDFRARARSFAALACYYENGFALTSGPEAQGVRGLVVASGFFDAVGLRPFLGRGFAREDEAPGGGPGGLKTVLSHALWQRQFRGDPGALGQRLTVNGLVFTVVGVMPAGAQFPVQSAAIDLYLPLAMDAIATDGDKPATEQRGAHMLRAVGRLLPGVPVEQAQAELRAIAADLEKQYPDSNTYFSASAMPLREEMIGDVRLALWVLCGAVGCVLLIACANVANLLLARASARGREIAVRTALGAGRGRIVRQLLTESVALAALGGALGLAIAVAGTRALVALVPQSIPLASDISLDGTVLAFTLLVSLGTGIVFGLVPALQAAGAGPALALKAGGRGNTGGRHRRRDALVGVEGSLALVLLVGAGLLMRSFAHLGRVDPGFRMDHLLTARVGLADAAYPKPADIAGFFDRLLERVRAIPGVRAASAIAPLPLTGSQMTTSFDIEERPLPEGRQATAPIRLAQADYFKTMGIPLLQGRVFDEKDNLQSKLVIVVNERFARENYPGQDPVGKRIKPGWSIDKETPWREIIGVVANVRHRNLYAEHSPEMYLPAAQVPFGFTTLVVRAAVADPASLAPAVRAALAETDRSVPLTNVRVFEEYLSRSLARPRFNALLLSVFAGVALVLTAVGVYGVMAYSVAQRTGEIGVRMALGAQQGSIFRLVVGEGMTLVAISIGLGLAGALALTRLLSSLLYGVGAWDPLTFGVISLLIVLVAFLACWLPARRAARVNPIEALRAE